MSISFKLKSIQNKLKVPKNQLNKFGGYNYRSCEDIVEAIKPLADKFDCVLVISDQILQLGERYYVEATATLYDVESQDSISAKGYARESLDKKGMDDSQITGSTSSYARKYALNGLFAIDDTKDADFTQGKEPPEPTIDNIKVLELTKHAKDKGFSADQLLEVIKTRYKKKITELTEKEYQEIIKRMDK